MKKLRFLPIIICAVVFTAVLSISCYENSGETENIKTSSGDSVKPEVKNVINLNAGENSEEMRGVWVTYMDLYLEENKRSEKDFTDKFTKIADKCKKSGFNALIVQVRPFGDALYESDLFPFSHIITGEQGARCDYDPLEIMCEICKERKLKIHAWVNPYRIASNKTPSKLSAENPYAKDNSLGVETENGIYYNPALPEVRKLITEGVCEIAENYPVDGIQFDDYFYPTEDEGFDKEQYEAYISTAAEPMSLRDWRKNNVNILVAQCYMELHKINNNIAFGISPQGNIENNDCLCADVRSWCKNAGYIDYICPQLYFSLDNPALSFEEALDQWIDQEYSGFCDLYIGLAGYKAGSEDSDEGTWKERDDILQQEIEILRKYNMIGGFMLYSYDSLEDEQTRDEIENVMRILN